MHALGLYQKPTLQAPSSLISAMIAFVVEWWWRKTLGLRSFQTFQDMSITNDAKAFLCWSLPKPIFVHHTSMFGSLIHDSRGLSWILHEASISLIHVLHVVPIRTCSDEWLETKNPWILNSTKACGKSWPLYGGHRERYFYPTWLTA
jgi:hypothetical protein